jgi:hypothetical protein
MKQLQPLRLACWWWAWYWASCLHRRKNGTDVGSQIADLVEASRASAVSAIAEAEDGDSKHIEKAISELDKGDREAGKGKPDKAVDKYGKAWEKARKAIR